MKDSDTVTFTTASLTYTTDKSLSLLADGQSMTQQPAYTPVTDTITAVSGSAPNVQLTFATPKDIVNFRLGDVVQAEGTGNPSWNETKIWSSFASMTNPNDPDPLSNLFDGDNTTTVASENGKTGVITFNPPINAALLGETINKIEIYGQGKPEGRGDNLEVNGKQYGTQISDLNYNVKFAISDDYISTISVKHVTGRSKTTVQGILVNDKWLVDPTSVVLSRQH